MQTKTLLLIILAALVAGVIAWFQYYFKPKRKDKTIFILSFLRFLSVFATLLLLVNPKFTKNEYSQEKTNLILLVDNSSSIKEFTTVDVVKNYVNQIADNQGLSSKLNITSYTFGKNVHELDSLNLNESYTDITSALKSIGQIYAQNNAVVVLLSDGNQNIGEDYEFAYKNQDIPVYPIVIGDTAKYEDLKIRQINSNKYAFLKNKYPLEIHVNYDGENRVSSTLQITVDDKVTHKENLNFSSNNNVATVNVLLSSNTVGFKKIKVEVLPLTNEKNKVNNVQNVLVEVIDEKTNVAIISNINHPDIAALKKAVESNEQRSVTIHTTSEAIDNYENTDLFVLYQPNASFQKVYDYINLKENSKITIVGPSTDWVFLNKVQNVFIQEDANLTEELIPVHNSGFTLFDISEYKADSFPPLHGDLGEILLIKPYESIYTQKIKGITTNNPLLAVVFEENKKEAVLFGENVWKWRMQTYRNESNFENFDNLIGKIVLYLTTTKPKERLILDYNTVNSGFEDAKITAAYFDEAFEFEPNASIIAHVKGKNVDKEVPFLSRSNSYELDLSDLPSGEYDFTVNVKNEKINKSGHFSILAFDLEKQLISSNYTKLGRLAKNTGGALFFPSQIQNLIQDLSSNQQFVPVQKSTQNIVPLIGFEFLLGIIAASLALEWFIRKYNGLT